MHKENQFEDVGETVVSKIIERLGELKPRELGELQDFLDEQEFLRDSRKPEELEIYQTNFDERDYAADNPAVMAGSKRDPRIKYFSYIYDDDIRDDFDDDEE